MDVLYNSIAWNDCNATNNESFTQMDKKVPKK
jgi:hypothetical protein